MKGKTALITGASRGIGRAIAIRLANEGARVAINFSSNVDKAEEVKQIIESNGGEAMLLQGNVADFAVVGEMIKRIVDAWGSLDVLVNNAGITRDNLLIRMKPEDFDVVIDTNLKGVFNCTKAVSRQMIKQRGGRIINMSSIVAIRIMRRRRRASSDLRNPPLESSRRAELPSMQSRRALSTRT